MTSLILKTGIRVIVPLAMLFAAYMTLKGHNEPGGGFIGGLVFAVAFVLFRMSFGREAFEAMIPIHPRRIIAMGLGLALLTAVVPLFMGQPLLRSHVDLIPMPFQAEPLHFASAMFFDLGVLLVVVGVSLGLIQRLSEELES